MAFSMLVAIAGIGVAWKIYLTGRGASAEKFAADHPELYHLVLDKYRVDELYEASVIQPTLSLNEAAARFDNAVLDGAVNGAGTVGKGTSGPPHPDRQHPGLSHDRPGGGALRDRGFLPVAPLEALTWTSSES